MHYLLEIKLNLTSLLCNLLIINSIFCKPKHSYDTIIHNSKTISKYDMKEKIEVIQNLLIYKDIERANEFLQRTFEYYDSVENIIEDKNLQENVTEDDINELKVYMTPITKDFNNMLEYIYKNNILKNIAEKDLCFESFKTYVLEEKDTKAATLNLQTLQKAMLFHIDDYKHCIMRYLFDNFLIITNISFISQSFHILYDAFKKNDNKILVNEIMNFMSIIQDMKIQCFYNIDLYTIAKMDITKKNELFRYIQTKYKNNKAFSQLLHVTNEKEEEKYHNDLFQNIDIYRSVDEFLLNTKSD